MLFHYLDLLSEDPISFLLVSATTVVALIIGITVHEFSHAVVAYRMGDHTARHLGRLTLNPIAHLDPIGSLMLLLAGFGWGKPVPVNALALRGNIYRGMALVSIAGPFSNIVVAALTGLFFKAEILPWPFTKFALILGGPIELLAAQFLATLVFFNLVLAFFNLIPLSPLDGSKVLPAFLPRNLSTAYDRLEAWGPGILLCVIGLDLFLRIGILSRIILPPVNWLSIMFTGYPLT